MFSKLLKHEWKANAGLLGILSLCALGVGVLGGGILNAVIYLSEHMSDNDVAIVGVTSLFSALMFIFLALVIYAVAVQFINLFRFYKNKFTDEGYLTFTLPVSAHHIFLSSFLNILAWMVISVLVVLLAGLLIVLIGVVPYLGQLEGDYSGLQHIFDEFGSMLGKEPGYETYQALNVLQAIIAPVYSVLLIMTSITLGCVFAKKHKILATVGMYYCINMVVGLLETIFTLVPTVLMMTESFESARYFIYMNITMGINLALQVGIAVGGYFLSTGLMKHKLNLP